MPDLALDYRDALLAKVEDAIRKSYTNAIRRQLVLPDKDSDIGCVYPISDDEVIVTQGLGVPQYIARINLKTMQYVWKVTGYDIPFGIDYNDVDGLLSVGHNSGIAILRASDGSIVRNITTVGGYTLSRIYSAVFNPDNPDELYFAIRGSHVLIRLNHVTGEYTMFGTWGTPKSDYTGLYEPTDVEVDPPNDDVLVIDHLNDRVLRLNMALTTVKDLMLLPRPCYIRKRRWGLRTQRYEMTTISGESGGYYPMYYFGFRRGRRLKFVLPINADMPRFTPDLNGVWVCEVSSYLLDLDRLDELYVHHPETAVLCNNASVPTTGYVSPPLTPFILGRRVKMILISNQTGTMTIQIPDRVSTAYSMGFLPMSVPTTFAWVDYESASTPAGVFKYDLELPPPVFRIAYTPSAEATVTLLVHFYP